LGIIRKKTLTPHARKFTFAISVDGFRLSELLARGFCLAPSAKGMIMWNVVIGVVFIIGGATGNLALIGTNSSPAIMALGAGLVVWGGVQMLRGQNR